MRAKDALQIIRKTRQNYNTIAKEWDISRAFLKGLKLHLLKVVKKEQIILDVGCGNGFILPEVQKRGASYVGFDLSEKLVALAKKKFKPEVKKGAARFFVADVTKKLPGPNNQFDKIYCYAVLHHIPSFALRLKALKGFFRVLKPGGQAIIINWNLLNDWADKHFKVQENLIAGDYPGSSDIFIPWKATGGKIIQRYLHIFTKAELKELAQKAGFKNIKIEFYNRAGKKTVNGEELVLQMKK